MTKLTKDDISQICSVYSWNPSADQLSSIIEEITNLVEQGKKLSKSECQSIISRHCPDAQFLLLEGVDNSDINTLLALAMKKQGR